jgi:hypothetical protein
MCDKLVFDLAQEVEGSPSVFVRKDWINILDNQNQSYNANQSVLDTSQLSNSNKYMSYREAYFSIPLLITMASQSYSTVGANTAPLAGAGVPLFTPATEANSCDNAIGLKNWFGNIIHSFTVDYNGSTIIQQTPFVNMWNSFKLMTSLSYNDILTQGCTIGFYPDNPETFEVYEYTEPALTGTAANTLIPSIGVCNNTNLVDNGTALKTRFSRLDSGLGNAGFIQRNKWINFDVSGICANSASVPANSSVTYGELLNGSAGALNLLYKSYIYNKVNEVAGAGGNPGVLQFAIVATVYLKHVHSFFNMIPLLKGVFIKMTMNLNNCSSTVTSGTGVLLPGNAAAAAVDTKGQYLLCKSSASALGGSNMLMMASALANNGSNNLLINGQITAGAGGANAVPAVMAAINKDYLINLSVGSVCLDAGINALARNQLVNSPLSKSIFLYIPAYTFNPVFEQAYLSSPVKQIKYTDIYQYQVLGVASGQPFNNLLTNGIANVKSVLILPYYSSTTGTSTLGQASQITLSNNTGFLQGVPVWMSPFDPAGCGPTSPLCHLTNFNVQVSGQNAIYNLQKYNFEQFNNQLYGQNAVNGGLTDGITSGLVDRQAFDLEYCYYYVNIERMLPVEQAVPKSIQVLGTNVSSKALDLYCFVEYGTEISIDAMTGSRV